MKRLFLLLLITGCSLVPRGPVHVSPRQHAAQCKLAIEGHKTHEIPYGCPLPKDTIYFTIRVADDCRTVAPARANEIVAMCLTYAEYRKLFSPPKGAACDSE
jgi:hypothetical protein